MDKKGLSPLIATVLMIAGAVSIGAVIMSWGSGVVEQEINHTFRCSDLSFGVHKFSSGEIGACYDETGIRLTLVGFRGRVENVKLVAYTTGEKLFTADKILSRKLTPGEPQKLVVAFERGVYGNIKELQLFPYTSEGEGGFCPETPVTVTEIPLC